MKRIAVLGSTGSIGTQTLKVAEDNPEDIEIVALSAGKNHELLIAQARRFHPRIVSIWDESRAELIRKELKGFDIRVVSGMDGLIEVARWPESDILVTALVGMIGIRPTIEAIYAGKDIALANKETLVTAGHIIMPLAKKKNVRILPVDSEHSAIFQCIRGEENNKPTRLLITASGGPFRGRDRKFLETVSVEDALRHPNWSMGRKITIDSATMVNKGLEVIEARWLFDMNPSDIQIVVQPQSIIHSMVEFEDGSVKAQLGTPDMKLPIQYALFYPDRKFLRGDRLDFAAITGIAIEKPDMDTFRGPALAYRAINEGGSMPTVLNAANEKAVALFLERKIAFLDIYSIIEACMEAHSIIPEPDLDEILAAEKWVYDFIDQYML